MVKKMLKMKNIKKRLESKIKKEKVKKLMKEKIKKLVKEKNNLKKHIKRKN